MDFYSEKLISQVFNLWWSELA